MRVRTISSLFVLALVGCAPAAPAPEAPKPPPPVASAAAAPAPRATWSFPSAVGIANAQLDLGDKGVLQVGERGRRWLIGKGEPTQAATLAPQDLVDVRVVGSKLLLLGEEGEVFTASDPLGAIESTKPAPKEGRAVAFRAGKDALLGLQKDGTLLRSTDAGATWSASKVPLRPGDVAVGLAANDRGEALVLLHPQRLLLSSDDGATWKPLATPGIGATGVFRDAKGDLFLRGSEDRTARLAGGKLDATATPASFVEAPGKPAGKKTSHESRHLAGDRVVTLVERFEPPPSKNQKLEIAIAQLGKEPAPPSVLEKSVSRRDTRVVIAGHQGTVVVAVHDEQVDPPATRLVRTSDDGKTWEQVGTLAGRLGSDFSLWAGPNLIIVGAACDDEGKACKPAQAKLGTKDWQEIPLPPKSRLEAVEIDPAHDRAWLLAWSGDGQVLLTGSLSKGTFTKTPVELPRSILHATSVDANGALRLAYGMPSRIVRVAPDLSVQSPLFLPFEARALDLVAERGFAWDGDDAWETADGGEKWAKVAPGTSGDIACAPSGCMQSGVVRAGWDLPDPKATLVASTAQPVTKKEASPPPPVATAPSAASLAVSCTASGAWKPWSAMPPVPRSEVALDGDVRFTMRATGKDQALSLVVARGAGAPTEVSLLGPTPKKLADGVRVRQWTQETSEGFVAVRYAFGFEKSEKKGGAESDSKYSPVDVELGWYAGATGKAKKAKLANVSPFRVGQAAPSALHAIVDGGLLFLPNGGDAPLHFLRDDGKTETIPRPPAGGWTDAVKLGGKIVLARVRQGEVTLASTSDAGKTWATTTWTLGQTVNLAVVDGKPALIGGLASWFHDATPSSIFAFDGLAGDPPDAVRVDPTRLQIGALEACTAKARLGYRAVLARSKAARSVTVTVAPDKKDGAPTTLQLSSHVQRVDATGGACTDAVVAGSDDAMWAIVSPHDPAHGWLVRAAGNGSSKVETRALSCKIAP